MPQGKRLRKALAGKGLVTAPGVYDMISARIADGLGFSALYMTGYGVSASLGLPDAGLASYTEMVERVAQICAGHYNAGHLRCRHRLRRAPQCRAHG